MAAVERLHRELLGRFTFWRKPAGAVTGQPAEA